MGARAGGDSGEGLDVSASNSIPIPSSMLEHEAQMLGFLDRPCACSAICSPQQMQIWGFITLSGNADPAHPLCSNSGSSKDPIWIHPLHDEKSHKRVPVASSKGATTSIRSRKFNCPRPCKKEQNTDRGARQLLSLSVVCPTRRHHGSCGCQAGSIGGTQERKVSWSHSGNHRLPAQAMTNLAMERWL